MNDRPSASELLAAVERFLEETAVPGLEGPARYHARVAANVVRIVSRELATEDEHVRREWQNLAALLDADLADLADPAGPAGLADPAAPDGPAALAGLADPAGGRAAWHEALRVRNEELGRRIRAGDADSGAWRAAVLAHLSRVVADKLDVAQPPRPAKEESR